ncbi:hypothetical protein C7N43_00965 [Sphingobacteriales bacterium UPWRP_1]|nr:hypothetical protein B6N25_14345 [Sphingobacteriales bacterium TSM_CSS]PSJ78890.1 hypothetical protein C7N43_00965 [Sphingobacteriales bacterium UPWRP_1]
MKKHLNPPQNVAIFNKTAGIYNAANGSILVGTFLGLLTEYAILRHILNTHLTEFWQAIPPLLITAAAGIICFFLAVERIRYGKEASKVIIDKESRQLGFAANGIVFVACFAIYGISVALSYIGTIDTVNNAIKAPTLQTTASTDSSTAAKLQAINRQYSTDSSTTAKQWASRINAESKKHTGEIQALQTQIAAGKHWLKPKVKAAQNEKETAINALKSERAAAMLRLTETKRQQTEIAAAAAANEINSIQTANQTAAARYNFLIDKAGTILPVMVLIALTLILFGCFIVEKFKYKSGIKEVILPNEYDLLPDIFTEYKEALKTYFSGILRMGAAAIRKRAIPATATVNENAAELIKLELEKYKERILQMGETNTPTTTPTPANIGFKQYPPNHTPENAQSGVISVITPDNTQKQVVLELLNTYKIERQRLQINQKRKRENTGNPETLQTNIAKHAAAMQAAENALLQAGFKVYHNAESRKIELLPLL